MSKIRVEFWIDDWDKGGEALEDAIDEFGAIHGVTLSSIGMAGMF